MSAAIDHGAAEHALSPCGSDVLAGLFSPLRVETLADVFSDYARDRQRMHQIAEIFDGRNTELVRHFAAANLDSTTYVNTDRLFALDPAIKALDAAYWQRALELTDVLEAMPQPRRDQWHKLVKDHATPPFERTTVLSTLQDLLAQRQHFFAERIDGIFRALSHEHVTNRPEGFSKRMILAYVIQGGMVCYSRSGTISDLRSVIARFLGRDEPRRRNTHDAIELAKRHLCGQWLALDGGALRVRVYKKGTAHLEVHPEISWRLNAVLASLYPTAIPEQHRRRPVRKAPKDFPIYSRPLAAAVVELLSDGRWHGRTFELGYRAGRHPAFREACDVLAALGGVQERETFAFDYDAVAVLAEVAASGVLPDRRAHQYYPTPADLAVRLVAAAGIESHHRVLEPSAGQGALARLLPAQQTTLVEVAPLHAAVLRAKGWDVIEADFLAWTPGKRFDRIVMNPPFAGSQWRLHLQHAADLVAAGGKIAAILPVGARSRRDILPGWTCTWGEPVAFPGTSIEVVLLLAEHTEAA